MNDRLQVLVIVGTVREGRVGRKIADWYVSQAKAAAPDIDFSLLDIAELELPLFDNASPPASGKYSPVQQKIAKRIADADAFVVVTGEYNHSIPGSLKNFLEYVHAEWNRKAAAYVGYGGSGAIRSIEQLIQVFSYLGVSSIRSHVTINAVWEALDERGVPKSGYVFGDVASQLMELSWWAGALKAART